MVRAAAVSSTTLTALTVATTALGEDPTQAAWLAVRVLPARPRRALAKVVERRARRPGLLRGLAVCTLQGPDAALADAAERGGALTPGATVRTAALAVAWDRPEAARALLESRRVSHPAAARLRALSAWSSGDLREAVVLLEGAQGGGRLEASRRRRLLQRLRGEMAVLDTARPVSRPTPSRLRPEPGRILHVVTNSLPHVSAGYTLRTHLVAQGQRAGGLDAHVVTRLGFPAAQGHLHFASDETVDEVPYHRLVPPGGLPRDPAERLDLATSMLTDLARRLRPSVLHAASDHLNAQPALEVGRRLGIPVVYEVRGFLEESWLSRRDAAPAVRERALRSDRYVLSRRMETHCMQEADAVTTLGSVMAADIVARGVPAGKVTVVPNAVLPEFLEPQPDPGPARRALGIGPEDVVVGSVTTFYRHEGLEHLLAAARLLIQEGAPLRVLLVGDGQELPALRRLSDELGLADRTVFTGRVPFARVRELYAAIDVFAVPRTDDRVSRLVTPLKPVEAMALRRPVVASDLPALRELVSPGVTGVLAPPGDPDGLAQALRPLLYDARLRARLGAAGHEWVRDDRTWSRNAERYRSVYGAAGALAF